MNRRHKLFMQEPRCHWCGELTEYHEMPGGGKPGPNEATIDHIYSKRDPRRELFPGKWVNAHNRCNLKRAEIENKAADKLWKTLAPFLLGDKLITTQIDPEFENSFQKISSILESTFSNA